MNQDLKSPLDSRWRWLLTRAAWFGGCALLLIACAVAGVVYYASSAARADLAREVAYVRKLGAPLTTIELQQSYQPAAGLPDLTAEMEKLITIADDAAFKETMDQLRPVFSAELPAPGEPWPELPEIEKFLAQHLDLLAFAKTLPDRKFTVRFSADLTLGLAASNRHAMNLVDCAQLLRLQLRVDMYRERWDDAAQRILELLAWGNALQREPLVTSQMMRSGTVGWAMRDLERLLPHAKLSDSTLLRLQTAFQQLDMHRPQQLAIRSERACLYTLSTWPFEMVATEGDWEVTSTEYVERHLAAGPKIPRDAALMLSYYRRLDDAAQVSIYRAKQECDAVDRDFKAKFNTRAQLQVYPYTSLTFPASLFGIKYFAFGDVHSQSATAAIAAVRFHRKHDRWPTRLEELSPEFLPAVPIDAFSGKPLLLRTSDTELRIYSVGMNETDDLGQWGDGEIADLGIAIPLQ